ncbi:MAG: redox-sensing transcriptional repressor Rex [Phycisphaerae bacterium]|nr:redox-sensing transcriptional repressor Rex [Phycisphaerae bacterium]
MVRDGNGPGSGLGIQLGYTATQVMSERASIPRATVKRLSLYLRELELHQSRGETTVSSRTLGGDLGITDAQVRRDFGYFGQFGQPGIGYSVGSLILRLKSILKIDREWNAAVFGVGNIGRALLNYPRFDSKGFHIVAAFDVDDSIIGTSIGSCEIYSAADFEHHVSAMGIEFGILCVPMLAAQEVADQMVAAGLRGILNFTPRRIDVGDDVDVVSVDFSLALEQLAYQVAMSNEDG